MHNESLFEASSLMLRFLYPHFTLVFSRVLFVVACLLLAMYGPPTSYRLRLVV